jgi:hypothetical protein
MYIETIDEWTKSHAEEMILKMNENGGEPDANEVRDNIFKEYLAYVKQHSDLNKPFIVSSKQAQYLRDMGFDLSCKSEYATKDSECYPIELFGEKPKIKEGDLLHLFEPLINQNTSYNNAAPTIETAVRWIRNKFGYHICAEPTKCTKTGDLQWIAYVKNLNQYKYRAYRKIRLDICIVYENALSIGIDTVYQIIVKKEKMTHEQ